MPLSMEKSLPLSEQALESLLQSYLHSPTAELAETLRSALGEWCQSQDSSLPLHVLKNVVEQSPVAISITDLKANILYTNACFTEVTGYSEDEIIGQNESVLSYKSTPAEVYQDLWLALNEQRRWRGTLVNRRKDGTRYLAEVIISPVLNDDGEVTHYLGIHHDITEMFGLERQIHNHKALIESVVDSTPAAMVVLDEHMQVLLDNQAYKKLITDMGDTEPAKMLLQRLEEGNAEFASLLKGQHSFHNYEVPFLMPGSRAERWFSCSGVWFREQATDVDAFFHEEKVPYLLLVAHEITAQKHQQEAIRSSALRALLAEEGMYQGVQETLTAAIFQLESPFNMLNAAMDMLERRQEKSSMDETLLSVLSDVREQARRTINNLQAAIPAEAEMESVPLNLNQLVHDVLLVSTERLLSEGIVIDWKPALTLNQVVGDEVKLRNMIKQLLDNAIESIVDNDQSRREIYIVTANEDEWTRLSICDSGSGIPEALRIKVFEPFYSTKGARKGHHAGMGLTLAQDVVNRHAGTLEIDSNIHKGCCLHVRLPAINAEKSV